MANDFPHDRFFKHVFGKSRHAEGMFRTLLARQVVAGADWSTLEIESGILVDEILSERESDLLYRVAIQGRTTLLYLLFEHQSTVDPLMPLRMFRFIVRIWDRWLEEHPGATRLPGVVPIVMYHGDRAWEAPVELFDMIDVDPAARECLPRLRFVLDDLTQISEHQLRGRRHLSAMAKVAQAALKGMRSRSKPAAFVYRWMDVLRTVGVPDLRALCHYIAGVCDLESTKEAEMAIQTELGETGREAVVTAADVRRAEGRAEARAEAVLAVFEARDMTVPDEVRARIDACGDPDLLEVWLKRAVKVGSPEEIFTE